jgi:hypothetical protein
MSYKTRAYPSGGWTPPVVPAITTDFRLMSGLWRPVFAGSPGNPTYSENPDGSLTISGAAGTTNSIFMAGVKSLFHIFPDANNELQIKFRFENITFASPMPTAPINTDFGLVCYMQEMATQGVGLGVAADSQNIHASRLAKISQRGPNADNTGGFVATNWDYSDAALESPIAFYEMTIKFASKLMSTRSFYINDIDYEYGTGLKNWNAGTNYANAMLGQKGISIFLGCCETGQADFSADLTLFQIIKGSAILD